MKNTKSIKKKQPKQRIRLLLTKRRKAQDMHKVFAWKKRQHKKRMRFLLGKRSTIIAPGCCLEKQKTAQDMQNVLLGKDNKNHKKCTDNTALASSLCTVD